MPRTLILLAALFALFGCSGDRAVRCEDDARYRGASSIGPLRIPDDLSVPDESEAITIPPPPTGVRAAREPGECLELPPDFFENNRGA